MPYRRLLKKLSLNSDQELGFELRYALRDERKEMLLLAELTEVMEPHGMAFAYERSGTVFLSRETSGSLGGADRRIVLQWLQSHPEICAFQLGELVDAWNPPRGVQCFERPLGGQLAEPQIVPA